MAFGAQGDIVDAVFPSRDVEFTDVDLNGGTLTVEIYNPTTDAEVYGVWMDNAGSTADVQLELTDGSDTVILDDPAAGDGIAYEHHLSLGENDTLQVNVTTDEGSAQTEAAAVSRGEPRPN